MRSDAEQNRDGVALANLADLPGLHRSAYRDVVSLVMLHRFVVIVILRRRAGIPDQSGILAAIARHCPASQATVVLQNLSL